MVRCVNYPDWTDIPFCSLLEIQLQMMSSFFNTLLPELLKGQIWSLGGRMCHDGNFAITSTWNSHENISFNGCDLRVLNAAFKAFWLQQECAQHCWAPGKCHSIDTVWVNRSSQTWMKMIAAFRVTQHAPDEQHPAAFGMAKIPSTYSAFTSPLCMPVY